MIIIQIYGIALFEAIDKNNKYELPKWAGNSFRRTQLLTTLQIIASKGSHKKSTKVWTVIQTLFFKMFTNSKMLFFDHLRHWNYFVAQLQKILPMHYAWTK